jgi:hypothetical protein
VLRRQRAKVDGMRRKRRRKGIEPAERDGDRMRSPGTPKKSTGTGSDDHISRSGIEAKVRAATSRTRRWTSEASGSPPSTSRLTTA